MLSGVRWFPGAGELITAARAEMPQKNDLCGAFVTLVALRANGIPVLDQDEAALAAGVRLSPVDTPSWPPGEKGREDYRISLPRAESAADAGASAAGIADAVRELSHGRLAAVPASGQWTPENLSVLLDGVGELAPAAVVANVDTAEFGAHDTPERALLDYVEGGLPPMWNSRWRTGHFVVLAGTLTGPGGTIVSIVDSYPSLGDHGVHFQLLGRLADALDTGRGLLLVVDAGDEQQAGELVRNSGLRPVPW
ncbi:hypothetical protein FPZ12_034665 [Amycolatopsis acidicola]|uniref:Peptidase C39-like domain-containing protein n=1 Tax=Amycolatopsis acidicola TaxID=2596893 RepID=A0A5N0UQM9_9PSEU|nr:hypothetical protein [Amycolatopsis acidicola]KAA9153316.1 hypothetical protein FPZ12_034665 [Amycolatopsis acidicola]